MSVFMVLQKPESKYDDAEGICYEYPLSIPNGRQIDAGDYLICTLTAKTSEGGKRIFGVGRVEVISHYEKEGRDYASAEYGFYRTFEVPLTFDEIGGDPRNNHTNAIVRIPEEKEEDILSVLLSESHLHITHIARQNVSPNLVSSMEGAQTDGYPWVRVFGNFPPNSIEKMAKGVAKKEIFLKNNRNVKGISSQDIEAALIGARKPLGALGYNYTSFSIGDENKAEVDGFNEKLGIAIEVEKGRGGDQIFRDLWKFILVDEIEYGVVIIPIESREGKDKLFRTTVRKFSPLEQRLEGLGLNGLAVIGY